MSIERPTIRCPHCDLMQFWTENDRCRRCHKPFADDERLETRMDIKPNPKPVQPPGIDIARSLRLHRRSQHLSQSQLAERLQVPRSYISKIENGNIVPTIASLRRFATALEIDFFSLLGIDTSALNDPFIREIAPYVQALSAEARGSLLRNVRLMARRTA